MSIKLKRSISPDGFINSLTIELDSEDGMIEDALSTLEQWTKAFQAANPAVQRGRNSASPPPMATIQAPPTTPQSGPSETRVGKVFSVQPRKEGGKVLLVTFADGTKLTTFDNKIGALVGRTLEYVSKEKLLSGGVKVTDLVAYKEVTNAAPAAIEAEGHANF